MLLAIAFKIGKSFFQSKEDRQTVREKELEDVHISMLHAMPHETLKKNTWKKQKGLPATCESVALGISFGAQLMYLL